MRTKNGSVLLGGDIIWGRCGVFVGRILSLGRSLLLVRSTEPLPFGRRLLDRCAAALELVFLCPASKLANFRRLGSSVLHFRLLISALHIALNNLIRW